MLVSGNGRNVGKTTLIKKIVERYAQQEKIIAVKISSHFHELRPQDKLIINQKDLQIIEEQNSDQKDSAIYLQAGAEKSYYIQCEKSQIDIALQYLFEKHTTSSAYIIESAMVSEIIEPAIHLFIYNDKTTSNKNIHLKEMATHVIPAHDDSILSKLRFCDNEWFAE